MITESKNRQAAPLSVILPYFLLSSISLIVLSVLFFFIGDSVYSHYFQPTLLSITHIAVLGFITSILFGFIYHMHYEILEVTIYSEFMAKISFLALLSGIIFLCLSFYKFSIGITCQLGAILTLLAFILFALNFFLAIRKSKANPLETDIISSSIMWLLVTGLVGMLLVFNFTYVFIPKSHLELLTIHAHLGFAGWIILLIMGVSAKITSTFYLPEKPDNLPVKMAYLLINCGLILLSISIYWELALAYKITSALLLSSGIVFFLYFLLRALLKRNRKIVDSSLNLPMISFFFLVGALSLGILLSIETMNPKTTISIALIYGILFILGFCGTVIIGQALKMIPFILLKNKYQSFSGKINPSLPPDLISEKAVTWVMNLFIAGVLLLCLSLLTKFGLGIKIAALFLTSSSVIFNYTIFRAIFLKDANIQ